MAEYFKFKRTKVIMPEIGKNIIEFTNYSQQQESPYCIYADFESVLKKESKKKTSLGTLSVLSHHMKKDRLIPIEGHMQGKFLWKNLKAWVKNYTRK